MRNLVFLLFFGVMFSCTADDPARLCCTVIDTSIDIKISDAGGNNILKGQTEVAFTAFDKVDGEWKRSRSQPFIVARENGNHLRVFANTENPQEEISELKLQFSDAESAIIKTGIRRNKANISVTKVWYNDALKWQEESQTVRIIEVQKD